MQIEGKQVVQVLKFLTMHLPPTVPCGLQRRRYVYMYRKQGPPINLYSGSPLRIL